MVDDAFKQLAWPIIISIAEPGHHLSIRTGSMGDAMHTLTARRQSVTVMTVSTLRTHLEDISTTAYRFTIHKVHRDRVSVRSEYVRSGKKKTAYVLLPAYPTGYPGDAPCNNLNVVLEPLDFVDLDACAERDIFAPLLGNDMLAYYERMHPHAGLQVTRCC